MLLGSRCNGRKSVADDRRCRGRSIRLCARTDWDQSLRPQFFFSLQRAIVAPLLVPILAPTVTPTHFHADANVNTTTSTNAVDEGAPQECRRCCR